MDQVKVMKKTLLFEINNRLDYCEKINCEHRSMSSNISVRKGCEACANYKEIKDLRTQLEGEAKREKRKVSNPEVPIFEYGLKQERLEEITCKRMEIVHREAKKGMAETTLAVYLKMGHRTLQRMVKEHTGMTYNELKKHYAKRNEGINWGAATVEQIYCVIAYENIPNTMKWELVKYLEHIAARDFEGMMKWLRSR